MQKVSTTVILTNSSYTYIGSWFTVLIFFRNILRFHSQNGKYKILIVLPCQFVDLSVRLRLCSESVKWESGHFARLYVLNNYADKTVKELNKNKSFGISYRRKVVKNLFVACRVVFVSLDTIRLTYIFSSKRFVC